MHLIAADGTSNRASECSKSTAGRTM